MNLFGAKDAGEGVKSALDGAGGFLQNLRSAITGEMTAGQRAQLTSEANEFEGKVTNAQSEVNAIGAQHPSLFVAGWRPAAGWMCVIGASIYFIINPIMLWVAWLFDITLPTFDIQITDLMMLLGGMLGLSVERMYEKIKGAVGLH